MFSAPSDTIFHFISVLIEIKLRLTEERVLERITDVTLAVVNGTLDIIWNSHPLRNVTTCVLIVPAPLLRPCVFAIIEMFFVQAVLMSLIDLLPFFISAS